MSFQIGFDLYESATQNFLGRVLASLKTIAGQHFQTTPAPSETKEADSTEEPQDEEMKEEPVVAKPSKSDTTISTPVTEESKKHYAQLLQILSGEVLNFTPQ